MEGSLVSARSSALVGSLGVSLYCGFCEDKSATYDKSQTVYGTVSRVKFSANGNTTFQLPRR